MSLVLSKGNRRYGFRTSPKDERDLTAKQAFSIDLPNLPSSVDLEPWCGPVKDQKNEGSCTAHAGTSNLEFLYRKLKNQAPIFSPQFLYYKEREMDGSLPGDTGSMGRTSVKCLQQFGCALESTDPYDVQKMDEPPTEADLVEAAGYKAGAYHALTNLNEMKCCLVSGFPFLIGFSVSQNFESNIDSNGIMPAPSGGVLGGHEVLVIGYDDNKTDAKSKRTGYFKVRNSWGVWGDHGNFYMSYEDIAVISEMWIQHFGKPW
jgi:C1A family cysteine protease